MKAVTIAFAAVALSVGLAAPASADTDTDFTNALHIHGIYGQKDYNAWIAKISCKRLDRGTDPDAYASAEFIRAQLDKDTTIDQAWQFLGLAIPMYCPEQQHVLLDAAAQA